MSHSAPEFNMAVLSNRSIKASQNAALTNNASNTKLIVRLVDRDCLNSHVMGVIINILILEGYIKNAED